MMTKVIAVSDEAYSRLASIKGEKSFTKVILELTEKRKDISEFFGIWKGTMSDEQAEEWKREIKESRKRFFDKGYLRELKERGEKKKAKGGKG